MVRVYSGKDGAILQKNNVAFVFTINKASANFGQALSMAGDIDHDGEDDLLIGIPGFAIVSSSNLGAVQILSGRDGHLLMQINSSGGFERFGAAVDGVGDVNGDGFADLLVGAFQNSTLSSDAGAAYLFSGQTGARLQTVFGTGGAGNYFGQAVTGVGDLNHDGHADFAVGGPGDESGAAGAGNRGRVYVYDGAALPTSNQGVCSLQNNCSASNNCCPLLYMFSGDPSSSNGGGASMGFSLDGAGDVDSDGYNDIVVGQTFHYQNPPSGGSLDPGNVKLFSGKTGALLFDQPSSIHADHFGTIVAGGQDVNGDCLADWLGVGDIDATNQTSNSGRVEVFSAASGFAAGCFPNGPPPSGSGGGDNNNDSGGSGSSGGIDQSSSNAADHGAASGGGCGLLLAQSPTEPLAISALILLTMLTLAVCRFKR